VTDERYLSRSQPLTVSDTLGKELLAVIRNGHHS
jgi:hypothetical protein